MEKGFVSGKGSGRGSQEERRGGKKNIRLKSEERIEEMGERERTMMKKERRKDVEGNTTPARFELAPQDENGLAGRRVNHSATVSKCSMRVSIPRLLVHKTNTLPTELIEHGTSSGIRTHEALRITS